MWPHRRSKPACSRSPQQPRRVFHEHSGVVSAMQGGRPCALRAKGLKCGNTIKAFWRRSRCCGGSDMKTSVPGLTATAAAFGLSRTARVATIWRFSPIWSRSLRCASSSRRQGQKRRITGPPGTLTPGAAVGLRGQHDLRVVAQVLGLELLQPAAAPNRHRTQALQIMASPVEASGCLIMSAPRSTTPCASRARRSRLAR